MRGGGGARESTECHSRAYRMTRVLRDDDGCLLGEWMRNRRFFADDASRCSAFGFQRMLRQRVAWGPKQFRSDDKDANMYLCRPGGLETNPRGRHISDGCRMLAFTGSHSLSSTRSDFNVCACRIFQTLSPTKIIYYFLSRRLRVGEIVTCETKGTHQQKKNEYIHVTHHSNST
jgi:transcriptional antiterminator Rof (Rho-off)